MIIKYITTNECINQISRSGANRFDDYEKQEDYRYQDSGSGKRELKSLRICFKTDGVQSREN